MPASDWKYIENQFEVATRNSYKKMNTLSADHLAKLDASAVPEVAPLRTRYLPVHNAWKATYNAWKTTTATYAGSTRATMNKLDSITRQVGEEASVLGGWENKIAGKYPQGSSKYRAIFPRGRTGVTEGTLEERVSALAQLGTQVDAAGGLATLATEIKDFAAAVEQLRKTQQEDEGHADAARLALEPERLKVARMLYGNLGVLMDIHRENPPAITGYFDLSVLRNTDAMPPEQPDAPLPSPVP